MRVVSELALAPLAVLPGKAFDDLDARDHLPRDHLILGIGEQLVQAGLDLPLGRLALQICSFIAKKVESVRG